MSVENLKEYARRCATEPELLQAARDFGMENMDGHMEAAERLGLDWDMEDMTAYAKELVDHDTIEDMTKEQLEEIAGGFVATAAGSSSASAGVAAIAVAGHEPSTVGASASAGSGW